MDQPKPSDPQGSEPPTGSPWVPLMWIVIPLIAVICWALFAPQ